VKELLSLVKNLSEAEKSQIIKIITASEENIATEFQYLEGIILAQKETQKELQLIKKTQELYNKIEEIKNEISGPGIINIEDLKCFRVLNKYITKQRLDQNQQLELSNVWGIKQDTVSKFFAEIKKIPNAPATIQDVLRLVESKSYAVNHEVKNYIAEQSSTIKPCMINLFYDQEKYLLDIRHHLANYDKDIKIKIQELGFFVDSGDATTAQNFLVSSLLYQKYLKTITKFVSIRECGSAIANKINIFDIAEIDITNEFSVGLKRKEKVISLGTYQNISERLLIAQSRLELTNEELIGSFKSILRGKNLFQEKEKYQYHHDSVKTMYDLVYLLFSCETNRNPSALISNAIFLELVKNDVYKIENMVTHMPMAMKGAIQVGRHYHDIVHNEDTKKVNDYGIGKGTKHEDKEEFARRESNLLEKYSPDSSQLGTKIAGLIKDWYGIEVEPLNGLDDDQAELIDWIDPYFGEYTLSGLSNILELRLSALNLDNFEIILARFFDSADNNLEALFFEISKTTNQTILIPLSLYGKHAAGLIFEKKSEDLMKVTYMDSLNEPITPEIKQSIIEWFGSETVFEELMIEKQRYNNCAPETIENFIFYLTGERKTQVKAIEFHSQLVESNLLGGISSDEIDV
jgi:hypothetical protein